MTKRLKALVPYLFTGPALLFTLVFIYIPMIMVAVLSFSDWDFISPRVNFVGVQNYSKILNDVNFHLALKQTGIYVAALVPAQIIIPLALAYLLLRVGRGWLSKLYRTLFFIPSILAFSIAAVVWLWLFNPIVGFFNAVLTGLGLPAQNWLNDPNLAIWSVIMVAFWKNVGMNMLLFLSALVSVPVELTEAATLEGAGRWQRFWQIDLPLISPTLFFVTVTTVLHVLDEIVGAVDVLTEGGPANSSSNLLYFVWERAFLFFQFGDANAAAVTAIVLVGLITWIQFKGFERYVHYR